MMNDSLLTYTDQFFRLGYLHGDGIFQAYKINCES